jgi:hypothetical protein
VLRRFLERCANVPAAYLVQIEVVNAEATEARVDRAHDVGADDPVVVLPSPIGKNTLVAIAT